jgi:hypothetical protein
MLSRSTIKALSLHQMLTAALFGKPAAVGILAQPDYLRLYRQDEDRICGGWIYTGSGKQARYSLYRKLELCDWIKAHPDSSNLIHLRDAKDTLCLASCPSGWYHWSQVPADCQPWGAATIGRQRCLVC